MKIETFFKLILFKSKEDTSVRDKRLVKRRGRQRNTDCRYFQLPPSANLTPRIKRENTPKSKDPLDSHTVLMILFTMVPLK